MKIALLFLLLSICFVSCNADKHKEQRYHALFDIEKSLSVENKLSFTLNDIAKKINLIPVATNDSCLMENLFIAGTTEDHVISYDKQAVYAIDKTDGAVMPIIKRQGLGPGEYKIIMDVALEGDSLINIYDSGKRGFLQYDFRGKYLGFVKNDSIASFRVMSDGNICATTSPFYNNNEFFIELYDRQWNLIRRGIANDRKDVDFDMYYANDIRLYNDKMLFRDYFGDTIYNVSLQQDTPYIVLSQGKYKMPFDIAADNSARNSLGKDYVQGINYVISSKYCFLRYYLREKAYFDIWHIPTSELLYRRIAAEANPFFGIDVEVSGTTIPVWVDFAKNNCIYCVIEQDFALKIMPSLREDSNPILLEIKL